MCVYGKPLLSEREIAHKYRSIGDDCHCAVSMINPFGHICRCGGRMEPQSPLASPTPQ